MDIARPAALACDKGNEIQDGAMVYGEGQHVAIRAHLRNRPSAISALTKGVVHNGESKGRTHP